MGFRSSNEPCSISAFLCTILLISVSSLAYPLAGEEEAGKCHTVELGDCDRVRLTSNHSLPVHLPGAPATEGGISVASCLLSKTTTHPVPKRLSAPRLQTDLLMENFTSCVGSTELEWERPRPIQMWRGPLNEGYFYILFQWKSYHSLLFKLHQPEGVTVNLSCLSSPSICLQLSPHHHPIITNATTPENTAVNIPLARRDAHSHDVTLVSSPSSSWPDLWVPVLLVAVGILALMVSAAMCAKGKYDRTRAEKQDTSSLSNQLELTALTNGLSPEAMTAGSLSTSKDRPKSSNSHKMDSSEEVRISLGFPDSPLSGDEAEEEKKRTSHTSTSSPPFSEEGRSRRSQEPLPEPPQLGAAEVVAPIPPEDGDKDRGEIDVGEDDEPPYDYARVPGQDREEESSGSEAENNENDHEGGEKVPGKYAKVTRHSGVTFPSQETSYAEVRDLVEHRQRSVTEPIDPSSVRDPMPLPRTYTDSASHLPLPAIPRLLGNIEQDVTEEDLDDMYDSVKDEVKAAAIATGENKQKVYEAVDDMDEDVNGMYESVPDELKESVKQLQPPAHVQPLPPKSTRMTVQPSNSPSPTKRRGSDGTAQPESPIVTKKQARKQARETSRKEKHKSKTEDEEDSSKSKNFSLFGRKKSRSVTAGSGKGRKEFKHAESPQPVSPMTPEHRPPSIPPPAVPFMRLPDIQNEDDDEDDTYDSVTVPRPFSCDWSPSRNASAGAVKTKSASLPMSVRSTGLTYNPHTNEPLPEVPEDSGSASGGTTFTVKHKRQYEPSDPRYDIVGTMVEGHHPSQAAPKPVKAVKVDPQYDTVIALESAKEQQLQDDKVPMGHQYAQGFKPSMLRTSSVDHDELGYAVVDPSIISRKRSASMHEGRAVPQNRTDSQCEKVQSSELGLVDPGYDKTQMVRHSSDDPGYDSVKNQATKPEAADNTDITELAPGLEDPGYESVSKLQQEIAGVELSLESPDPGYETVMRPEDDLLSNSTTPPVEVAVSNDMYSHVDLVKKHQERRRRLESGETENLDVADTSERMRTPSPAPPIPPIGDLGDLSEFQPPPIPQQNLGVLTVEVEPPYSKVVKTGDGEVIVEDGGVVMNDAPGYEAVDVVVPLEKRCQHDPNLNDFTPGYQAANADVPQEKPQSSPRPAPISVDNLVPLTPTSLQQGHAIYDSLDPQQRPADYSDQCSHPVQLKNSVRTGEHLYEELDKKNGNR